MTSPDPVAGEASTTSERAPSLRGRILLNSAIQFAGRGANGIGAIVILWILTRYLGPAGFGRYTFVTAYISLFYVATDLGWQSVAVREMARDPERSSVIAGQLFTLKFALAALALVIAVGAAWLVPAAAFAAPGVRFGVVLAALVLLSMPLLASAIAIYQTALRMTIPAIGDALTRAVTLILVVCLAAGFLLADASPTAKLDAVILATTIGLWAGAVFAFLGARRLTALQPRYQPSVALPMLRDALPLGLILVLTIVQYRIDVLILSFMRGMSDVGIYGVATKLLDVALAAAVIFMGLALPVLSQRATTDRVLLQRAFQKAIDFMLIVGVGAAVCASGLSPVVVRILAGSAFTAAGLPVAIIAWAIPLMFAGLVFSNMVLAVNRQMLIVPVTIVSIALNVVLNIALIPRMGPTAPAVATVITEFVSAVGIAVVMARSYRFGPSLTSVAKIMVSGALAAVMLLSVRQVNPVLAVALAAVVYAGSLLLTGVVRLEDARAIFGRRESEAIG